MNFLDFSEEWGKKGEKVGVRETGWMVVKCERDGCGVGGGWLWSERGMVVE